MKREGIEKRASELMESYDTNSSLREYGKPLFLVVTGADSFGFASPDSDIDIKGIYQAPNEAFLGFRKKVPTYTQMSKDKILDLAVDEVGHYFKLLAKSNADRIEWANSDLIVMQDESVRDLGDIVNQHGVSKKVFSHYLSLARQISRNEKKPPVKGDLYALRTYMTGITLLETGQVVRDIEDLNERFGFQVVGKAIESKNEGETTQVKLYSQDEMNKILAELDERLISAHKTSTLAEEPNHQALEDYLIKIRTN